MELDQKITLLKLFEIRGDKSSLEDLQYYDPFLDKWSVEMWEPIIGYEGLYEISDLGRVKALKRDIVRKDGQILPKSELILKPKLQSSGYPMVGIWRESRLKNAIIHLFVWDHFGSGERNKRTIQVDHVNHDKSLCWIKNLQLLTARENTIKQYSTKKTKRNFTGVTRDERPSVKNPRWIASISINGKEKCLGYYKNELEASQAYQQAKGELT